MKILDKTLHYFKTIKEQMTPMKQDYKEGMQDFKGIRKR